MRLRDVIMPYGEHNSEGRTVRFVGIISVVLRGNAEIAPMQANKFLAPSAELGWILVTNEVQFYFGEGEPDPSSFVASGVGLKMQVNSWGHCRVILFNSRELDGSDQILDRSR